MHHSILNQQQHELSKMALYISVYVLHNSSNYNVLVLMFIFNSGFNLFISCYPLKK